jgi:hypothetical protein
MTASTSKLSRWRERKAVANSLNNLPTGGLYSNGRVLVRGAHARARARAGVLTSRHPPDSPVPQAKPSRREGEARDSGSFRTLQLRDGQSPKTRQLNST